MSKFKMMIVGIGLVGLMGACGEYTVDENVDSVSGKITVDDVEREVSKISEEINDLSDYPTSIQDGTVSLEYYNSILAYFKLARDFNTNTEEIEKNKNQYSDKERFQKHTQLNNEKIVAINGIKHDPTTEIEKEIDKYFSETLYYDEEMTKYKAQYYTTYDESYYSLAESAGVSYNQSGQVFNELLKKYGLHQE